MPPVEGDHLTLAKPWTMVRGSTPWDTLTSSSAPSTPPLLPSTDDLSVPCPRYCAQCSLVKKTRCDVLPKTITRRCRGKETRCQNQQNFPSTFFKAHFQHYKKANKIQIKIKTQFQHATCNTNQRVKLLQYLKEKKCETLPK